MKTKDKIELSKAGKLLVGDLVPEYFVEQSDACSTPFRRNFLVNWFLQRDLYSAGCYCHDWKYHLTHILFNKGTDEYRAGIKIADKELKANVKIIQKYPIKSKLHGFLYYRGVRWGRFIQHSRKASNLLENRVRPPEMEDLDFLKSRLELHAHEIHCFLVGTNKHTSPYSYKLTMKARQFLEVSESWIAQNPY